MIQSLIAEQIQNNVQGFLKDKLRFVNILSMLSSIYASPNLITEKYFSILELLLGKINVSDNLDLSLKIFDTCSRIGHFEKNLTTKLFQSIKSHINVDNLKTEQIAGLMNALAMHLLSN